MARMSYRERRFLMKRAMENPIKPKELTPENLRSDLQPWYVGRMHGKPMWEIECLIRMQGFYATTDLDAHAVPEWFGASFEMDVDRLMPLRLKRLNVGYGQIVILADYPPGGRTALAERAALLLRLGDGEPVRINQKRWQRS